MILTVKRGTTDICTTSKFTYNGAANEVRKISAEINSVYPITFQPFDTVEYNGSEFYLDAIPTASDKDDAGRYNNALTFYGEEQKLSFVPFLDFVRGDASDIDLITYSNGSSFSFIGTVMQLCNRILANINKYNSEVANGIGTWVFIYDLTDDNRAEERTISISEGMSALDALKLVFTEYDIKYKFNGKDITITDKPTAVIDHTFEKGLVGGLKDITATVNSDDAVVTRLYPQGGSRNLPLNYKSTAKPVTASRYCPNLMLPNDANGNLKFYIDSTAENIARYGTRAKTLSEPFQNIYPSIRNTTLKDIYGDTLPTVGNDGVILTGLSATKRVDKIIGSDTIDADSGTDFNIYVTDLGFDLGKRKSGEMASDVTTEVAERQLYSSSISNYVGNELGLLVHDFSFTSDYSYNIEIPTITVNVTNDYVGSIPAENATEYKCKICLEKKYDDTWLEVGATKAQYSTVQTLVGTKTLSFTITPDNLNYKYQTSGHYRIRVFLDCQKASGVTALKPMTLTTTSSAFVLKRLVSDNLPVSGRYEYASSTNGVVAVRSGVYGGFEFEIQYDGIGKLESTDSWYGLGARYKIPVKRYEMDGIYYPTSGSLAADTEIVLLNILMPPVHVNIAENKLQTYATDWLNTYSKENFTVNISLSTGFSLDNPTLFQNFVEWGRLRVKNDGIGLTERELDIQSVTIEYKEDSVYPEYKCTLSELPRLSWIEKLNKQLEKSITSSTTSTTTSGGGSGGGGSVDATNLVTTNTIQTISARKSFLDGLDGDLMGKAYDLMENSPMYGKIVRKDITESQSIAGLINFLQGIGLGTEYSITQQGVASLASAVLNSVQSPNFSNNVLGSGFTLHKKSDGSSYLEVDEALFRKKATFVELLIQELAHVGGQIVLSPARMKCNKVVAYSTYYRCYFEREVDGKTINNQFEVGDLARCQTFNEGVNRYYWRKVVSKGTNYINLSKTDCDTTGTTIPADGDDICQLGSTVADRQCAILLSAYGNDAPFIKMYRGINSYSLEGKEFVNISRTNVEFKVDSLKFITSSGLSDAMDLISAAQAKADEASAVISDITNDDRLTPDEKQKLKIEYDKIKLEFESTSTLLESYPTINQDIIGGWEGSYYDLMDYLHPLLLNLNTTSDIVGSTMRSKFSTYYGNNITILQLISATTKTLVDAANAVISDITNDNKLTPSEKLTLSREWQIIQDEYAGTLAQATLYGVDSTAYTSAYNWLYNNISTEAGLENMNTTSNVNGSLIAERFKNYYISKASLLNAISAKARSLVDEANAVISDITNDDRLTPSEKLTLNREWGVIQAEYAGILAQATSYGVDSTAYASAYNWLYNNISTEAGLGNMNTTSDVNGSLIAGAFASYYTSRTALLNAISAKAKSLVDGVSSELTVERNRINATINDVSNLGTRVTKTELDLQPSNIWLGITNRVNGNRNLIYNSGEFRTSSEWGGIGLGTWQYTINADYLAFKITAASPTIYNWGHLTQSFNKDVMVVNSKYTMSARMWFPSSGQVFLGFRDAGGKFYHKGTFNYVTGWNDFSYTFTYTQTNLTAVVISPSYSAAPAVGFECRIKYIKLELGEESTAWTPAPEDLEDTVKTGIQITNGQVDIFGKTVFNNDLVAQQIKAKGLHITDNVGNKIAGMTGGENGQPLIYADPTSDDVMTSMFRLFTNGLQTNGNPSGARIEIDPTETYPAFRFYDVNNKLVSTFNAESLPSVSDLFGSTQVTLKPSSNVVISESYGSSTVANTETNTYTLGSFTATTAGVFTTSTLNLTLQVEESRQTPPIEPRDQLVIPSYNGFQVHGSIRASMYVNNTLIQSRSLSTMDILPGINRITSKITFPAKEVAVSKGTVAVKIVLSANISALTAGSIEVSASGSYPTTTTLGVFNASAYLSRWAANGFIMGDATNNYKRVVNTSTGIEEEIIAGNYGLKITKTGIQMRINSTTWKTLSAATDGTLKLT